MKQVKLRSELRAYILNEHCCDTSQNPTLQGLDTDIISLLKGVDECGQVNRFEYSGDDEVSVYRDEMETVTQTEHELAYYQGLSENIAENASTVAEPAAGPVAEPAAEPAAPAVEPAAPAAPSEPQ